jgi:hypothetical protein
MLRASCHCGAVVVEAEVRPRSVTTCNCSICRRLGALWAYYTRRRAHLTAGRDAVAPYVWGDRMLEFYHCRHCGCCTHYESVDKDSSSRLAINARCFAPEELAPLRVRHFDGAKSFKYLDSTPRGAAKAGKK